MKLVLAAILLALHGVPLTLCQTQDKGKTIESLAVLPFINVVPDRGSEEIAVEITKKLITSLSKLPELKVVPFRSVRQYKGKEPVDPHLQAESKAVDPQTIGRKLGVQAVLFGRVVQHGGNLSISAELVDVRDKSFIWGDQYHRKASDIAGLEEEIANDISKKLRLR